ncbi:MAG TPA: hypothetical protein VIY27_15165, partial [Myxococcota bacterium]
MNVMNVGTLAHRDALMAYASLLASDLIRRSVSQPRAQRVGWLKRQLNEAHPGMGTKMAREFRELVPRVGRNQALFDSVRLALANRVADVVSAQAGLKGLGGSEGDINAVFCGLIGAGTVGGTIAASYNDRQGAGIVGTAGRDVLTAAGCDAGGLAAQARMTSANLQAAQLEAQRERER